MEKNVLSAFLLLFYFGFCLSQQFVHDRKCLYEESGASFTFDTTPQIDFYIPHNWINSDEKLNHLLIKLFSKNLVLRHPSSSSGSGETSLPLENLKVGWNRIYLRKDGDNLQVIERPPDNSINVIKTLTLQPNQDPLHVSGMYSLANCFKDLNTRYYIIPAGKSTKIPYVMYKQVDRIDAHSDSNAFNFEVSFYGTKKQVCKEEIANQPDVYSLPKDCRHWPVTSFSPNKIYNIFMYPAAFDTKDVLKYNDFTFTEFVIHNTGTTDFYIQTFIKPETSAPISLLKVDGSAPPPAEKPEPVKPIEIPTEKVKCGINNKKSQLNRIIGGRPANPKDWPWMAALLRTEDLSLLCGGVLIAERYVLTAIHCFRDYAKDEITVRLGEYDFGTANENNPSDFGIETVQDPHYIQETRDNDIALLRLDRPASFGEFIWPVCLPPKFESFEDRFGVVIGWGTEIHGGTSTNILREVVIPILKRPVCEDKIPGNRITKNMFCAGLRGRDSCQGDSGGPFLIQESDGRFYVVGIVSWGIGCGHLKLPGVYTKVNNYLDWINRSM